MSEHHAYGAQSSTKPPCLTNTQNNTPRELNPEIKGCKSRLGSRSCALARVMLSVAHDRVPKRSTTHLHAVEHKDPFTGHGLSRLVRLHSPCKPFRTCCRAFASVRAVQVKSKVATALLLRRT